MTVAAETPVLQASSGERSFTVSTESVENLPIANRSFARSRRSRRASPAPTASATRRRRRQHQHHDGRRLDDGHRQQPVLLQMNVESIAEVKVLVSSYQAEYGRSSGLQITAVTKSGTNRFRGSVYDVERNSDWNSNSRTNMLNGDPKTVLAGSGLGLLDRRPDRQARRQQQAVLLLQPRVRAAHRRQQRRALPDARPRSSAPGDFSQTDRQQRRAVSLHQGSARSPARARPRTRRPASSDGGVLGRIPANRLYQTGLNILKMYPDAEHPNRPGDRPTTTRSPGRPRSILAKQPAVRLDYQPIAEAARHVQVLGLVAEGRRSSTARFPASTTRGCRQPVVSTMAATVNYTLDADDVPRGDLRPQPERAGRLRPGAGRHRPDVLHRARCR